MMNKRIFNLKKDTYDERDYKFKSTKYKIEVPEEVDLRPYFPPIRDQGSLGSCVGMSGTAFREYFESKNEHIITPLSALYLYWHSRELIGTVNEDSGAYLRDAMKTLQKNGICHEIFYPYDVSKFKETPSENAELDAERRKIDEYYRIMTFQQLQESLAEGKPIVMGMDVYESFMWINKDGIVPMPNRENEYLYGGHALIICGYKKINGEYHIIVRNSWGVDWGDNGYCYIPKSIVDTSIVRDMWTGSVSKKGVKDMKLTKFSDIEEGRWSEKYIADCVSAGIIDGFEDGTFRPTESVTREQLATVLSKLIAKN